MNNFGVYMKKSLIFIILFVAGFSFFNFSCVHIGNRDIVSFELTFSSFDKIHNSASADIRYHAADEYRAVVTVDSNLEQQVELKIRNNTLEIGTKKGVSVSFSQFKVDVYCPVLTSVTISGSGDFVAVDKIIVPSINIIITGSGNMQGTFECDTYSVKISGSGDLKQNIICKDFSANMTGSGNFTISGSSDECDITITGSGDFKGLDFKTKNANVRISGSGNLNIWVTDNLTARITGSGDIRYRGNPRINVSGGGSGKIRSE
jgi:hypothetical protein